MPVDSKEDQAAPVVRLIDGQQERVETGPVQFGDDWPGVFIRGDAAFHYVLALRSLLAHGEPGAAPDPIAAAACRSLCTVLASAIVGPARDLIGTDGHATEPQSKNRSSTGADSAGRG